MTYPHTPQRSPTVGAGAMLATSHPAAVRAGIRAFKRDGNAVDAALSSMFVLCAAEPMNVGLGGDTFALVWRMGEAFGLDAAGPATAKAREGAAAPERGSGSVTLPGAVAGWAMLSERFGRLGWDQLVAPAIDAAESGVAIPRRTLRFWQSEPPPADLTRVTPSLGQRVALPELGATLRGLAERGPDILYGGPVAEAIASVTDLTREELAAYRPCWVTPMSTSYRGHSVLELPPPTQGVVALEALALLEPVARPGLPDLVRCVAVALEDGFRTIRDGEDAWSLLSGDHLADRARTPVAELAAVPGDTAFVCAVDADGLAVSLIASLYECFGSHVVVPGTGVVLQNRAACFNFTGGMRPGRRPFHTIIPAALVDDHGLRAVFGVVGGLMQAQAHVQVVSGLLDDGLDPQACLDRARFRVQGAEVVLEPGLWKEVDALGQAIGREVRKSNDELIFGAGQMIERRDDRLLGGSDSRMDGYVGVLEDNEAEWSAG